MSMLTEQDYTEGLHKGLKTGRVGSDSYSVHKV